MVVSGCRIERVTLMFLRVFTYTIEMSQVRLRVSPAKYSILTALHKFLFYSIFV